MKKRGWIIFGTIFGLVQTFALTSASAQDIMGNDRLAIESYNSKLRNLSPSMTEHSFSKSYVASAKERNLGYCGPKDFCSEEHVESLLSLLQNERFKFIAPISLPQTGQEMITELKQYSSCKNLGFMNVMKAPGYSYDEPVPLRPTRGLGIYILPIDGRNILLIRGEEYQLAWPSWGADLNGPNLPVVPQQVRPRGIDFLFEVDAKTCSVINTFNLRGLRSEKVGQVIDLSFAEPIVADGRLFIFAMESNQIADQSPTYGLWLFQISRRTGSVIGKFFYATYF